MCAVLFSTDLKEKMGDYIPPYAPFVCLKFPFEQITRGMILSKMIYRQLNLVFKMSPSC